MVRFNKVVAEAIGTTKAIVLEEVKRQLGDMGWVSRSDDQLQKQLPCFSISTIRRTVLSLRSQGIVTAQFHRGKMRFLTINHGILHTIVVGKLGE